MAYPFTPAVCRVLEFAAQWSAGEAGGPIDAPEVLLGLLAQNECRAAAILAQHSIDAAAVLARWPNLHPVATPPAVVNGQALLSDQLQLCLAQAMHWLGDLPKPLNLATEHVLLGIVAGDHEASAWLRDHGLSAAQMADSIARGYGYSPGTTTWNYDLQTETLTPAGATPGIASLGEEVAPPSSSVGQMADERAAECAASATPPAGSATPKQSGGRAAPAAEREITSRQDRPPAALPCAAPREEAQRAATSVWRILDAVANRAREGLRVVEDYVRFILEDRHLTAELKSLRHDLARALAALPTPKLLAARDTTGDVGTQVATISEGHRADAAGVLAANFKRLQESLRSLEEFSKLIDPRLAKRLEAFRYRSYTLEQAVQRTLDSLLRLEQARLYVLIPGCESAAAFERLACSLVSAGVPILQLRDKTLDDRTLLARARLLREITRNGQTLFIMNDRPDLALLAQADGVHVGQNELAVADVRRLVGPEMLIGVSTHSLDQARKAVVHGAGYLGLGPTFPSGTKTFEQLAGLELLRQVAADIRLPAFAIGGISKDNVQQVLSAGLKRVAVSGAVVQALDPANAARELLDMLAN